MLFILLMTKYFILDIIPFSDNIVKTDILVTLGAQLTLAAFIFEFKKERIGNFIKET